MKNVNVLIPIVVLEIRENPGSARFFGANFLLSPDVETISLVQICRTADIPANHRIAPAHTINLDGEQDEHHPFSLAASPV